MLLPACYRILVVAALIAVVELSAVAIRIALRVDVVWMAF
jgi:hypothetical protein